MGSSRRERALRALDEASALLRDAPDAGDAHSVRSAAAVLGRLVPWLEDAVRADSAGGLLGRWGLSTVIDENTRAAVVGRSVLEHLHALAGIESVWPVGNAGLLHVYGYLLSAAETPYGFKRDRWTAGGVARACGLEEDRFAPWFDGQGTPLSRILDALSPLIDRPSRRAGVLVWTDETLESDAGCTVVRTLVVGDGRTGDRALVYALGTADDLRLVTAFPLGRDGGSGDSRWLAALVNEAPRLRYNAVIEGHPVGVALNGREVRLGAV